MEQLVIPGSRTQESVFRRPFPSPAAASHSHLPFWSRKREGVIKCREFARKLQVLKGLLSGSQRRSRTVYGSNNEIFVSGR
ncbi:hypothetical protein E2C01_027631 [Portunus trituberculatus]|uniref:Uncharacterized protein n=1 Tax=Portunus trituberculatus TaxID=210409 RepID=A0A5B7EM21_PORTR|nr:hypothetical protein [Portunus trituberculatus]